MDRDERREIRKRGAASRQLATGNDIVIKTPKKRRASSGSRAKTKPNTPKWIPVSQDSGALITEELSLAYSPEYHHNPSRTTTPKVTPKQKGKKKNNKKSGPVTPKELINEEYEPQVRQNSTVKKVIKKTKMKTQAKPEPKKSKKAKAKEIDDDDDDDDEEKEAAEDEDYGEGDEEYQDEELVGYYDDRFQANLPGESDDEDEDIDDVYSVGTKEIKISRLPTSMARLTSIDIVQQSLNEALANEDGDHFKNFQKLNKAHLGKLLDLNLTNNRYLAMLRELKSEKQELRKDLFEESQEINEKLRRLEQLRSKYNQVRTKTQIRKKITKKLQKIPKATDDDNHYNSNESILTQLNKLNSIIDPNWGLLEKLKELNNKFYELEQQTTLLND